MTKEKNYFEELKEIISSQNFDNDVKDFEQVLNYLKTNDIRSLVIIGVSYIEGLLKDIMIESFSKNKRVDFFEKIKFSYSFSFGIEYLYAKSAITEEIYIVLNNLRKLRNIYAHHAILKENETKEVSGRINNIEKIISKGWGSSATKEFDKIGSDELVWVFVAIENLGLGLIALKYHTIPEANMVTLAYKPGVPHLSVAWHSNITSEGIMDCYRNKFRN
ncbi:MAG: hypothetical protein SFY56_11120 [Bacteroidota bacterium]|nr:hypothetical protein [Bacteroidota bacterium]